VGNRGVFGLLISMMFQIVNYVEIEYLEVYKPNNFEKSDPDLFSENVFQF
jgi:hypothetical protein